LDRVTENLLAKFTEEHGLPALPEDRRFEHFASYITVRQQHRETFDTADIATGGGNDTGIDAIAVLVNGQLVTDVDELADVAAVGSLDVMFVFVQADRGAAFEGTKIANFGFGVVDFFDSQPKLPRNQAIANAAAIMTAIYEKADKFRRGRPQCRLYFLIPQPKYALHSVSGMAGGSGGWFDRLPRGDSFLRGLIRMLLPTPWRPEERSSTILRRRLNTLSTKIDYVENFFCMTHCFRLISYRRRAAHAAI
jgi:hypothetical protein